jgi:ornithine cyclodeaminase
LGATVLRRDEIESVLDGLDLVPAIEAGFVAYSRGRAVVPPVGELLFEEPRGEAHIKYGYIEGDEQFVVKVATGFYGNAELGLPGNSGLMLLFSRRTGMLESVLLEEGHLTNMRTAVAAAITVKRLAPSRVQRIAVFGTGLIARMTLRQLLDVTPCREVILRGRRPATLEACRRDVAAMGYAVEVTTDASVAARDANVIVTATAATSPVLTASHVQPGTHITAVGADTPAKQELDTALVGRADVFVADSLVQCAERGELHHAIRAGVRGPERVVELGAIIADPSLGRTSDSQLTIADLTGVAVQDICIATAVARAAAARRLET